VWADKSTDVSGRVSRNGRILPFVDWTTYGLSVRDLASGEVKALDPGKRPFYPRTPTPSYDGTRIAYVLDRSLHIVPVDGGPSKMVYQHPHLSAVGDWTADSASLIIMKSVDARQQEIGILDIAAATYRKLADGRGGVIFSTAGSQPLVVFDQWIRDAPSRRELRILSLKDGGLRVLLTGADDFAPAWSPKGDAVVFVSNRDGHRGLWSMPVRDGQAAGPPRLIRELTEDLSLIGLTSDGTAYFSCYGGTLSTYVARLNRPGGEVSEPKAIATPRFLGARRPVFSPDGAMLATVLRAAYPGVRPGWQTPAVTELSTGRQWTFPSELTIRDETAWLPDGRSLIAINDDAGSGEGAGPPWTFWRLSLADTSMKRVGRARASGLVRLAGVTEREIVYKRDLFQPSQTFIEALDLQTGSTREIYRSTEEVTDASLSPDGRQLAFTVRSAKTIEVYLLHIGAAAPTKLPLPNFRPNARPQAMWVATQDALVLSGAFGEEQGIWRVPLKGDPPQRLKVDADGVVEARLSPDGRAVAYTTQSPRGRELWMLQGAVTATDQR
jgi:Tol biopolymer transport system component